MRMLAKRFCRTFLTAAILLLPATVARAIPVDPDFSDLTVLAQAPAPAPDPAPAPAPVAATAPADNNGNQAVTATIFAVKGNVGVQASEDAPMQPAAVGMKLEQGAVIHTGLRSFVQFLVGKDEMITVDRISVLTL